MRIVASLALGCRYDPVHLLVSKARTYNRRTMSHKELETRSAEETQVLAAAIGARCRGGEVLLLTGELGSGKTCFAQGLARGLDVKSHIHSPTFVLATEHTGRLRMRHVDLYRIESVEETLDLGLDELGASDLVGVVEWADRVPGVYPFDHLTIELADLSGDKRSLTFSASGEWHAVLLEGIASDPAGEAG